MCFSPFLLHQQAYVGFELILPMAYTSISGGVTAPQGFLAGAVYCGIKATNADKPDIALVYTELPAVAAGTFTTNKVKAAPVRVSMQHVRSEDVRAVIANAGNANACTGLRGIEDAKRTARAAAKALGLKEKQVLVCSTGRIGVPLPIDKMEASIAHLPAACSAEGSSAAAAAIMTSDTKIKEVAVEFEVDGKMVRLGGIAKGAGMIDPNMATMLCFITTDVAIDRKLLKQALSVAVEQSFNRITVDGDMSTNDTVIALANGASGCAPLIYETESFRLFQKALDHVTRHLARLIVEDGEGVTKFVEVHVSGGHSLQDARRAAEAVGNSSLVKCAWFGNDPNWGRIMDAIGYADIRMREELVDIYYDGVQAVKGGIVSKTPPQKLKDIVSSPKFTVRIDLHMGTSDYTVYTTDLSVDYVTLNMGE